MQDLGGEALLITQQSQQKMLGSNVLVRKALSLLGSVSQNPPALVAQREIDRGRELLPDSNVSFNLLADGLDRGIRTQEPVGEKSFVFAQKSQQQVLRLYVRRTELTGLVARKEDDASCFLRVVFEHISPHAKFSGKVSGRAIVGSEQIVCAVLSCNCKAPSEARVLTCEDR